MKASRCRPEGGFWQRAVLPGALASLAWVSACSAQRSDRSLPTRVSPVRVATGHMLVQSVPGDAGIFLPATAASAAAASDPPAADSELLIEENALGGQMVRLHGRFSGVMRAQIVDGAVRSDCLSESTAGAGGSP